MILRKLLVGFFLFITITGYCQNDSIESFDKKCFDLTHADFQDFVIGKDTLKYFICSKFLSHTTFGNIKCYTADVIFPAFSKKKKDFRTRQLAMFLIYKYDLFEVRIFKTCGVRSLARMSIRPPDSTETAKIEKYIKKNLKTFKRSVIED